MALTSLPIVFLTVLVIHQSESGFTPTTPTIALTCNVETFDLTATYTATTAAEYSQSNDLNIGDEDECAETGTAVSSTGNEDVSKTGLPYGSNASPGCGTGAAFNADTTKIEYTAEIKIKMTVTKGNIQRVYIYKYNIKCTLTRDASVSTTQSFTVTTNTVEETVSPSEDGTFNLGVTLQFLDGSDQAQPAEFIVNNKDNLNIQIIESPVSAKLKFTVQQCYASNKGQPGASGAVTGDIISGECPVDATVAITDGTNSGTTSTYNIVTRAFILKTTADGTPYFLHCSIYVCLESETGAKCVHKTDCPSERKRRSIVNDDELSMRIETITSVQSFTIIDNAYTTDCPNGHVFDTLTNLCTNARVFKVLGVHLDKQWDPEYANTSSTKFKWFAKNTARELRSLILATGVEQQIRGIEVIAAREGSVILDVLITYGEDVEPREAFGTLKNILYHTTPQVTRLVNVLKVIKEKTVELVPVEMGRGSSLDRNLIIVVVFAVVAVAFISAIALYQVQKLRRRQVPSNTGMAGIDNSGLEKA